MLIVSQNKDEIVNLNNVKNIETRDYNKTRFPIVANMVDGAKIHLAEYTTMKRAKEVLKEIYCKYSDFEALRMVRDIETQKETLCRDNSKYFDVYEIPKE